MGQRAYLISLVVSTDRPALRLMDLNTGSVVFPCTTYTVISSATST